MKIRPHAVTCPVCHGEGRTPADPMAAHRWDECDRCTRFDVPERDQPINYGDVPCPGCGECSTICWECGSESLTSTAEGDLQCNACKEITTLTPTERKYVLEHRETASS